MAFALGLIDLATRRDIKIIKDLRNKCAHLADEILIDSDSISQPISELTCLQEFTEVLESKEPFKNLGLSDRVSGAKSRLLLKIEAAFKYRVSVSTHSHKDARTY